MPLYLTRFSYTPVTWARLIGKPEDRRKAAESYIESVGELRLRLVAAVHLGRSKRQSS
jgi:hypothetical protein